jgi:hypothetical protein
MASLLESALRKTVATAFKGKLLKGSIRRVINTSVDGLGDPTGTAKLFPFEGIRDNFTAQYAQAAGIPLTDARFLIIAGSCAITPQPGDQISLRNAWFEVRQVLAVDPANATISLAAFAIPAP